MYNIQRWLEAHFDLTHIVRCNIVIMLANCYLYKIQYYKYILLKIYPILIYIYIFINSIHFGIFVVFVFGVILVLF